MVRVRTLNGIRFDLIHRLGIITWDAEITLMYLLLIPIILSGLVNPVHSVLAKIDCRSLHRKINKSLRPILYILYISIIIFRTRIVSDNA